MPAVEEAASDGASDATPAAAAASAAAAAEPIGTGRVKRRSALKRAKDKVSQLSTCFTLDSDSRLSWTDYCLELNDY